MTINNIFPFQWDKHLIQGKVHNKHRYQLSRFSCTKLLDSLDNIRFWKLTHFSCSSTSIVIAEQQLFEISKYSKKKSISNNSRNINSNNNNSNSNSNSNNNDISFLIIYQYQHH
ncbi:hypothetical protein ACTFIU_009643 [Dictyostelium citrinum]